MIGFGNAWSLVSAAPTRVKCDFDDLCLCVGPILKGSAAGRSHHVVRSMGSECMVQELERLRKLLDVTPVNQLRQDGTEEPSASETAYSGALSAAEVGLAPSSAAHCLSSFVTSLHKLYLLSRTPWIGSTVLWNLEKTK